MKAILRKPDSPETQLKKLTEAIRGGRAAVLVFKLPEDKEEFDTATKGMVMWCILWDFVEHFLKRKVLKGEHDYKTADEALKAVWDYIYEESRWSEFENLAS